MNIARATSASTWLAVSLAVLATACSMRLPENLRRHTYPPDFNYISDRQLESTMWQLADRVNRVDDLLRDADPNDTSLQAAVVKLLAEMDVIIGALGPGGWPSNHPKVTRNIDAFRNDLGAARRAAESQPPSYYLAGSISGACMHCHESQ